MSQDGEVYPMPLFVRLTVTDLAASVDWYRELGFDVVYEMPAMAHVRYRKYADVMLVSEASDLGRDAGDDARPTPRGDGVEIYVNVENESVDDVAERATQAPAHAGADADGPHETGWNTREFAVRDPDGYRLVFSEPVDTERSFEDVMGEPNGEE